MKRLLSVLMFSLIGLLLTPGVLAQDPTSSAETATDLRVRLVEVQAREAELQARLSQLNEDLKPQNIERFFAGVGSTRPEELREQRRKQLSIESDGVHRQLELLATSRARLESGIQIADSRAYQESARGFYTNQVGAMGMYIDPRWLLIPFVTIVGVLVSGFLIARIRRS